MELAKTVCRYCVRTKLFPAVSATWTCRRTATTFSTVSLPQRFEDEVQSAETGLPKKLVDPLQHPDYFKVSELFTIKDLFQARVHLGHKEGSLDNRMKPFIFGSRLGHLVFDLDITAYHLRQALNFTAHIAYNGGVILFVYRGAQNTILVERTAKECGEFAHTRYWRKGTFTNSVRQFGTITRLPDLCIFLNTLTTVLSQHVAVLEAAKMLIPSVGVVDTNCDPNLITYPIPGNDDTPCSIELYCKLFKEAIRRGKEERTRVLKLLDAQDESNQKLNKM